MVKILLKWDVNLLLENSDGKNFIQLAVIEKDEKPTRRKVNILKMIRSHSKMLKIDAYKLLDPKQLLISP
jgi:hypothetical protein